MGTMMELSEDEVNLVLEHRIKEQDKIMRILSDTPCEHNWVQYASHGRDTLYVCLKCDEEEWV